jgi:hypothetical protein
LRPAARPRNVAKNGRHQGRVALGQRDVQVRGNILLSFQVFGCIPKACLQAFVGHTTPPYLDASRSIPDGRVCGRCAQVSFLLRQMFGMLKARCLPFLNP